MDRTVPRTASDEIELYLRTLYSLLRSSTDVQIRTLEEVHAGMNSSLHPDARKETPDPSAFIYSILRLPDCMPAVRSVVLGQNSTVFDSNGLCCVEAWQKVSARARRRSCFYDGQETLACFISSRSDIEDIVPSLTAYQIEWNKLHHLLQRIPGFEDLAQPGADPAAFSALAAGLGMPVEDLRRLQVIWGADFAPMLRRIAANPCSLRLRLLNGSLSAYWRSTRTWWENIERTRPELLERPVYFISSNTHSAANLLSGFALQRRGELMDYLNSQSDGALREEWKDIQARALPSSAENFLYYLLKKYQQTGEGPCSLEDQHQHEETHGISRIPSAYHFDVEAQVYELSRLAPALFDPRLKQPGLDALARSDALILNIDYPLGLSAYNILAKIAEHANPVLGVYILGKAASLNGVSGDVIIPNVVQDEHSQNTYLFQNVFSAGDVAANLVYGTVLDNQKAVSVLGTFLQNARVMDVVYREGYTDIEMEAGPYLSAVYEMYRPTRHPVNEIVNLYGVPFDIGVLHYVSDTPLSKGKNLGAGALSYFGMDSTYATTVAVLRRIMQVECRRLGGAREGE
jgi:hypothetical protein